jgi:hypothetical protein
MIHPILCGCHSLFCPSRQDFGSGKPPNPAVPATAVRISGPAVPVAPWLPREAAIHPPSSAASALRCVAERIQPNETVEPATTSPLMLCVDGGRRAPAFIPAVDAFEYVGRRLDSFARPLPPHRMNETGSGPEAPIFPASWDWNPAGPTRCHLLKRRHTALDNLNTSKGCRTPLRMDKLPA